MSQVRSISPSAPAGRVFPVAFCPVLLGRDCVRPFTFTFTFICTENHHSDGGAVSQSVTVFHGPAPRARTPPSALRPAPPERAGTAAPGLTTSSRNGFPCSNWAGFGRLGEVAVRVDRTAVPLCGVCGAHCARKRGEIASARGTSTRTRTRARAVADALDFQNAIRSPAAATATVVRCVTMCRAMCDPRRPARVFEFLRSRARFPPYTRYTARAESGDRARWPRARAAPPHMCG